MKPCDYAAACSQLIIHGMLKRSTSIPNFAAQNVLLQRHLHFPACCQLVENPLRFRRSFVPTESEKPLGSS